MTASPGVVGLAREPFGKLADGTAVEAFTLSNGKGVTVRLITIGAAIQAVLAPDASGAVDDVVLGYDTAQEYLDKPQYFGASIGRYANRIAHGRFTLDGKAYQLETNDGPNHLHGGFKGFDKRVWSVESASKTDAEAIVVMSLVSPDGDGGYPGELAARVTYALNTQNELAVTYEASTTKATIVSMTNHSFFNLAGAKSERGVLDHMLQINAESMTPVDGGLIPTGEVVPVAGTPFDFRKPRRIGDGIREADNEQIARGLGYDHNWVLTPAAQGLTSAAVLSDPESGRTLEVLTSAPAVQFYSGNFLNGKMPGKGGVAHRQGDALCLEPQVYPDAPNHPSFPSARLDPGQTYTNRIVFRFGVQPRS